MQDSLKGSLDRGRSKKAPDTHWPTAARDRDREKEKFIFVHSAAGQ